MAMLVRPVGDEIQVNTLVGGFSMDPTTTRLASGNYVVIWSDNGSTPDDSDKSVRGQMFDADGAKIGGEFRVNTTTAGSQFYGTVAPLASGGFAVSWVNQDSDVRVQIYDAAGAPVGGERVAGTLGYYDSYVPPAITELASGGFVVAWGNSGTVVGRLFDAAGNPGSSLTFTAGGFMNEPALTTLANGNFVLTWSDQSGLNGDPNIGVLGQIYDATGTAVAGRFLVNTRTAGTQYASSVRPLADGGFVVTWTENGPNDTNTGGIRAQVFASNGDKVGNELVVSALKPSSQAAPTVQTLPWGGFMIVWEDYSRQDGDFETPSIRAQLFDSDGSKIGDELRVNTQLRHYENDPVITVLSDTRVVVTWSDTGGSGAGPTGILSRVLTLPTVGTTGDDSFTGTANQEAYTGRAGNDVVHGMAGDDILEGAAGDDALHGGADNDMLGGGEGSDTLHGDAGNDNLDGGAGNDILDGGSDDDSLDGKDGDDIVSGGAGNDRITSLSGIDTLYGGAGDDVFIVAGAASQVFEAVGEGSDVINAVGSYALAAGAEIETLAAYDIWAGSAITLTGNAFANRIVGNAGNNVLSGEGGDDLLHGGAGADVLIGGAGVDTTDYTEDFGAVTVNLATGVGAGGFAQGDSYSGIENVVGTGYNDALTGDGGVNRLNGDGGDDLLHGGAGGDALIGGAGVDTADYTDDFGAVIVDLASGAGAWNYAEGDSYSGIENVVGTGFNDALTGDGGANQLAGGDGDDTLGGADGSDILRGGAGADMLNGGAGIDTADYSGNFGSVIVNLAAGAGAWNYAEGDVLVGIENVVGTGFNDMLTGDAGINQLAGAGGDDLLHGGAGGDLLNGGAGVDTADYAGDFGAVIVNLATGVGAWNYAEGDSYSGIENVIGTSFSDTLTGNGAANLLHGGAGSDTLTGGGGIDTADYSGDFGAIIINLAAGVGAWNYAEGDSLIGIENVVGTAFNDLLTGDAGANALSGGGGDDLLHGGAGSDVLTGGAGVDTVDYSGDFGAVIVNLAAGGGAWNYAEGDSYSGIENAIGTSFNDVLQGDGAGNRLSGGGGEDLFVFGAGFGVDVITDFVGNGAASGDRIQFGAGTFSGFADLMAHAQQQGSDVVITLDAGNALQLVGVQLNTLDSGDFLF